MRICFVRVKNNETSQPKKIGFFARRASFFEGKPGAHALLIPSKF